MSTENEMTLAQAVDVVLSHVRLHGPDHPMWKSVATLRAAAAREAAYKINVTALRRELTESKQREQAIFENLERTREGRDMVGAELRRVTGEMDALRQDLNATRESACFESERLEQSEGRRRDLVTTLEMIADERPT